MTPCSGSQRPILSDPICYETGQRVHQNSDAAARRRRAEIPLIDFKSFRNNVLRRRSGRARPARIVHVLQLRAKGRRETRPTTIEET